MWNNAGRFVADESAPVITQPHMSPLTQQDFENFAESEDDLGDDLAESPEAPQPPTLLSITRFVCGH